MKAVFTVTPEQRFIVGAGRCLNCDARQTSKLPAVTLLQNKRKSSSPVQEVERSGWRSLRGAFSFSIS